MKSSNKYYVELTDTFSGDANYSWLKRFIIRANTKQGAISKLSKETGFNFRIYYDSEVSRYNAKNACICAFIEDNTHNTGDIPEHVKQI